MSELRTDIEDVIKRNANDESVTVPRWLLEKWRDMAVNTGLSESEETREFAKLRSMLSCRDTTIQELRLEVGRLYETMEAGG